MLKRIIQRSKNSIKKAIKFDYIQNQLTDLEHKVIYQHIAQLERRISQLEGKSSKPLLDFGGKALPNLTTPVSQLVTQNQFDDPLYHQWCEHLRDFPRYHRKQWEFVYILRVLDYLGFLNSGLRGVGFGVGEEPIADYLASCGVGTLITDLSTQEAIEKGWVDSKQHLMAKETAHHRYISSEGDFQKLVQHRFVDMNNIPSDIKNFDFTWSACAFEHLGSIDKGLEFVKNSLKCIKPGGVAVHTTEFNVSSLEETIDSGGTVLFRKKDMEKLQRELRAEGHEIEFNFSTGGTPMDQYYDIPPYSENVSLKIQLDKYITTSIGLYIKKNEKRLGEQLR